MDACGQEGGGGGGGGGGVGWLAQEADYAYLSLSSMLGVLER